MTTRVSQLTVEALTRVMGARASQIVVETLSQQRGARVSQSFLAPIITTRGSRASQLTVKVLVTHVEALVPLIYPTLPGLSFTWIRRPIWSTGLATASSGREVRVGYWQTPLWEWDLTYEYLPDFQGSGGATPSDYKTLLGFFTANYGRLGGFYFLDPDDNTVVGQYLGSADGQRTRFPLVRDYGPDNGVFDYIGGVVDGAPFRLYADGVLQDSAHYTLDTANPLQCAVRFSYTPAAGVVIKADLSYYFYCRFKEDTIDFEKFMNKLWLQKHITIRSLRG